MYVLYTDTPWLQVPYRELGLPSGETCRRRLEEWQRRGLARAGAAAGAAGAGGGGAARLVAGDRRRVAGGGEKGGEKVARTLRGTAGSRYHLAVDANGAPLEVRLAAGNENEQRHLLPLLDALPRAGSSRGELWADRGYASRALEQALRERQIEPRISKPRRRRRTDPRRHTRPRGLARQEATAQDHATRRPATAGRSNAPTPG